MSNIFSGNDNIFRTYVKGDSSGNGKAPAEKIKGRGYIRSFEDASKFDSFGAILKKDIVDISFDSKEMYEKFLDMAELNQWRCLCLPSAKGGHSFWKDTEHRIQKKGAEKTLAVGFVADIHSGDTYIPLRVHGVDRFPPDYDILEGEEYQEVPDELLPINTNISLWSMGNGEGRNDDLYRYIMVLQSQLQLSKEQIRTVLQNTNQFVFSESLDQNELEVILRDDAFKKPIFFNGAQFLFDKFAIYIMTTKYIKKVDGRICIYDNGIYKADQGRIEKAMLEIIPNLSDNRRKEVLKFINIMCQEVEPADARYIAFRNGIYDVVDDRMLDFSPEIVVTNKIPWDYTPTAFNELTEKTLNKLSCGDAAIRMLLEECIGYCFYRRNNLQKAFILIGDKSNGKSTFIELLNKILGDENVVSLDLKNLNDRFSKATLYNKLANVGDDISDEFIPDASLFKKIVSGNRIQAEFKGKDLFEFNPYVKLIFSANSMPRIKDKTGAVLRRLVIIPFNATFKETDTDYDPNIKYKLSTQDSIEYLIALGVQGLQRLKCTHKFTQSERVQKELDDYEEFNNPVLGFIKEQNEILGEGYLFRESAADIYTAYQVYCNKNGLQPESNVSFGRTVKALFNVETVPRKVGGKSVRIYRLCSATT